MRKLHRDAQRRRAAVLKDPCFRIENPDMKYARQLLRTMWRGARYIRAADRATCRQMHHLATSGKAKHLRT